MVTAGERESAIEAEDSPRPLGVWSWEQARRGNGKRACGGGWGEFSYLRGDSGLLGGTRAASARDSPATQAARPVAMTGEASSQRSPQFEASAKRRDRAIMTAQTAGAARMRSQQSRRDQPSRARRAWAVSMPRNQRSRRKWRKDGES